MHSDQLPPGSGINVPILDRRPPALPFAARLGQFSVHVHQPRRARPLMQVVHILRAEKESVAQLRLQLCQRKVGRIRLAFHAFRATCGVELPHQRRITPPRLRRAHILDTMSRPQPSSARNVGSPLSALIPAPVKTNTRSFGAIEMVASTSIPSSSSRQLLAPGCFRELHDSRFPSLTRTAASASQSTKAQRKLKLRAKRCSHGSSRIFPVVFRSSISVCALPASASGYMCSMRSFRSPLATQPSTSLARHSSS